MQNINITQQSPQPGSGQAEDKTAWVFRVEIKNDTTTEHTVTLSKEDKKRLVPKHSPEELIWASFLFLLDRESKESILSSFDLMVIARYFPEYEHELKKYL